jgi:hypothetical protein
MNKHIEEMKQFGALRYSIEKIISLLDPDDPAKFKKDFANKKSDIRIAYEKGKDQGDYMIDKTLFSLVQTGDVQAYDRLMTRIMLYEENQ